MDAFADTMHLAGAARADGAVRLDDLFATRQVFGQRAVFAPRRLAEPFRRSLWFHGVVVIGSFWRRRNVSVGQVAEPECHLGIDQGNETLGSRAEMQGIDRAQRRPQPLVVGGEPQHQLGDQVGIGGQVLAAQRQNRTRARAASPRAIFEIIRPELVFSRQARSLATMPVRRAATPVASMKDRSSHRPLVAKRTCRSPATSLPEPCRCHPTPAA